MPFSRAQRSMVERIGRDLREIYPPDAAADDTLRQLIAQLDGKRPGVAGGGEAGALGASRGNGIAAGPGEPGGAPDVNARANRGFPS